MPSDQLPDHLQAAITLRHPAGRVGAERIALLDAIRRTGSISAAARAVGLSYKAAWDAVQVLNNLFDRPLVVPSTGGRDGGTSVVTEAGATVIEGFGAVEAELARAFARLEQELAGASPAPLWGSGMRTSARNALRGTVTRVVPGGIDAEVVLAVAEGVEIVATLTRDSVDRLGLVPGTPALALVKSSLVVLARGQDLRTSARNALPGTVIARHDDAIGSEVTLQLALGKTLTATLTRHSADALDLAEGADATALIKASHVIIALE